jgi:hypothetical protein
VRAFVVGSLLAYVLVVLAALGLRSRGYALFRAVGLGLHTAFAAALYPLVAPVAPLFIYLHAMVYLHSLCLVRPRMRSLAYRALVSIPGAFFAAGTLLALPWVVLRAFGFSPFGVWLPYVLALIGIVQSLTSRREIVDVVVGDGQDVRGVRRMRGSRARATRPLRIVQITDPHLGPFMSVQRLRRICERAVARQPDLVFLTGYFLTMEEGHA